MTHNPMEDLKRPKDPPHRERRIRNALHIMRIAPTGNKAPDMLAMMERQVTHLVRLVDDLLDVSRIGQGKIDFRKERISLQSAVLDAAEASCPLIENSAHTLTFNLPEESDWIDADLTRVA